MPESNDGQTNTEVIAWQSIRASIGVFDNLVMTLLTQGTIFVFAAFGVIFGNSKELGDNLTTGLCLGILFGTLMLALGVWRYTFSIRTSVESAQKIEDTIFGKDAANAQRITHLLATHPIAAARFLGFGYYLFWAIALMVISLIVVLVTVGPRLWALLRVE